jgi:hypothetical protein
MAEPKLFIARYWQVLTSRGTDIIYIKKDLCRYADQKRAEVYLDESCSQKVSLMSPLIAEDIAS